MQISVTYNSLDGYRKTRVFGSLKGARKFAQDWVGEHPEIGSTYAVSSDGIGKVQVAGDATLNDLFPIHQWLAPGSAERRAADRVDGYDRDDLGESPDY
jgi:hypothetical protein